METAFYNFWIHHCYIHIKLVLPIILCTGDDNAVDVEIKIRWAKYLPFQPHWSYRRNTFVLPWPVVLIT